MLVVTGVLSQTNTPATTVLAIGLIWEGLLVGMCAATPTVPRPCPKGLWETFKWVQTPQRAISYSFNYRMLAAGAAMVVWGVIIWAVQAHTGV